MAQPMPATHASQQTPAFVNMISLFLNTPSQSASASSTPGKSASPAQIADSMIRSMLGGTAALGGPAAASISVSAASTPAATSVNQTVPTAAPVATSPVESAMD